MPDIKTIKWKLGAVEDALARVQVEAAKGRVSKASLAAFKSAVGCVCDQADGTADTEANAKLAEAVLKKVEATTHRIDTLVSEGRKFNASLARQDLHAVTASLNDLLLESDLSAAGARLAEIDQEASRIHGLFFPEK